MQIQLKKGLLDIIVLTSLIDNDSYGYKIIQDVSKIIVVSESTLYPILRRLEISECLSTYTKEYNGRLRKYYRLQRTGYEKIKSFIEEWGEVKDIYEFIINKMNNRGKYKIKRFFEKP